MTFEVVNHCHRYPRLLAYQLSSLVLHPPSAEHEVRYTLYHANEDDVLSVVAHFERHLSPNVFIWPRSMPLDLLRNRANGRDDAARETTADWVWFTDTDYLFLRSCWSDLAKQLSARPDVRFAAPLAIHETDWPTGDAMIRAMEEPNVRPVDLRGIPKVRKGVAIGGLQIAHGPTLRRIGYCPRLCGPRDGWDFRSDVRFRKQPEMTPKLELHVDAVLRIRHSTRGYGGTEAVYN